MSEVTSYHVMKVTSVYAIHTERKVVHETKCIMGGPNAVKTIDQCIKSDNCVADVALG